MNNNFCWSLPTIEEIYNEYHKQTFYIKNGVYPKSIINFKKLYEDQRNVEYLNYFIEFLKRNRDTVNWKIYILALAKVLKTRYDLKYLGSFGGNKIYRDYLKTVNTKIDSEEVIISDIINSLKILSSYNKENNITFKEYFEIDSDTIPLALKHIYAGTISPYFYACFSPAILNKWFAYNDDVFFELFQVDKHEFLNTFIISKRDQIMQYTKVQELIFKFEQKLV